MLVPGLHGNAFGFRTEDDVNPSIHGDPSPNRQRIKLAGGEAAGFLQINGEAASAHADILDARGPECLSDPAGQVRFGIACRPDLLRKLVGDRPDDDLECIAAWPDDTPRPERLILLGTPSRPPRLARRFHRLIPYRWINGQSGQLLARSTFFSVLPVDVVPCTVVAGTRGWQRAGG